VQEEQDQSWKLQEICGLPVEEGAKLVDFDCTEERLFLLTDDLTLHEVSLESNESVREVNLGQIAEAEQIKDQKAKAFSVFKDIDMLAVATSTCVVFFDYASGEPSIMRVLDVPNVTYIDFLDCNVILCI
jgi:hypothetical protein